ncbi:MAG TPA: hypothetical protein VI195_11640 [Steroidobacteraceae bacterium]
MRNLTLAVIVCSASVCWAEEPADTVALQSPIHLDSAADLEQLRKTNPDHYARAVRLIKRAGQLCDPGAPKVQNTDGRDISCATLLLTSNPPKRELSFTLDHTSYVTLVTITTDRPQLVHADQRSSAR